MHPIYLTKLHLHRIDTVFCFGCNTPLIDFSHPGLAIIDEKIQVIDKGCFNDDLKSSFQTIIFKNKYIELEEGSIASSQIKNLVFMHDAIIKENAIHKDITIYYPVHENSNISNYASQHGYIAKPIEEFYKAR